MKKRLTALIMSAAVSLSLTACSGKDNSSSSSSSSQPEETTTAAATEETAAAEGLSETKNSEEGATAHISPMEIITANTGSKFTVDKVIGRADGSNTYKVPLSELVEEGDRIKSFTFVVYGEGGNINTFKGGFGVSVTDECPSATDKGWYQSEDVTEGTQGGYGEITWNVPADVADCINTNGDVLFGYWWGDTTQIRLDSVICEFTRTVNAPVDGTESQPVEQKVNYNNEDELYFKVPIDFLPEKTVPQAITVDLSADGDIGMYQGAFVYESDNGSFTDKNLVTRGNGSSMQLTWIVPDEVRNIFDPNGTFMLGYWYGDRSEVSMNQITVKYSTENTSSAVEKISSSVGDVPESDGSLRSASEIVDKIKIGWNVGNALDSYKTGLSGVETETGWGNPKTTQAMIKSVKSAGFNAVRIPVTWGEHMDGDTIQKEWLDRVQEVVDYAYNEGLFVILNVHHDDYIWLTPNSAEYPSDSAKLKAIWTQVAKRFKDYDDKLLFEGMNEPRTVGSSMEWLGGTTEERAIVNNYEADFIKTVRNSGGNNKGRTLIITSYAASAETKAIDDIIVPKGGNIIVSVHYYAPWKFSDGTDTTFNDDGKAELDAKFAELKSKFIDKGTPVIIDEFGCVNAADEATRSEYFKYYVSAAKKQGIKCFIWDNGVASGEGSYGLMSRTSCDWNSALLGAVMDGANS